jgi:hypothetical protein
LRTRPPYSVSGPVMPGHISSCLSEWQYECLVWDRGAWLGDLVAPLEIAAQGVTQPSKSALSLRISSQLLLCTSTRATSGRHYALWNGIMGVTLRLVSASVGGPQPSRVRPCFSIVCHSDTQRSCRHTGHRQPCSLISALSFPHMCGCALLARPTRTEPF